jgi:hypothetical protein
MKYYEENGNNYCPCSQTNYVNFIVYGSENGSNYDFAKAYFDPFMEAMLPSSLLLLAGFGLSTVSFTIIS